MSKPLRVLMVEDNPSDAELALRELRRAGFEPNPIRVETEVDFLKALDLAPEVILADYGLPYFDGLSALDLLVERKLDIPFILLSGSIGDELAVQAIVKGASDYLLKDRLARLGSSVKQALERKEIRQALEKSRNQYQHLFDQANDVILVFEPEQEIILEANAAACSTYGYSHNELVGMSLRTLTLDPGRGAAHINEFLQGRPQTNFESIHVDKSGEHIDFLINCSLIEYGSKKAILSINRDITKRTRAEFELSQSEKRFRALIENSSDAVTLVDAEGRAIYDSPAAPGMLGYAPEDWIGKQVFELVHPDDIPDIKDLFQKLVEAPGSTLARTFRVHHKSGSWLWIEAVAKNLLAEPAVKAIVVNYRDITARKQAEEALYDSEGRYRNLFEDSPIALWDEDFSAVKPRLDALRQGGTTNFGQYFAAHPEVVAEYAALVRVRDVNKEAMRLFRANRKEDLMGSLARLLEGEAIQGFRDELVRIAEGTTSYSWEGLNKTLDGKRITTSVHWSVVPGYENSLSRTIVSLIDITERERAAARMQRQLEHLSALSAIDRVISSNFDLRLSLAEILAHVTMELGVDAADVLILNSAAQFLEFGAERGFHTQAIRKAQVHLGANYAGRIAVDRQDLQIPDLRNEPEALLLTTLLKGEDFIYYYGLPLIAKGQVNGVLEVFHRATLSPDAEWIDFLHALAGQAAIAIENSMLFESFQRSNLELTLAYDATIEGWSRALDLRDKETEGHTQRVTEMTVKLARSFDLSEPELMQVRWGALLHDIGKMGVPDGILLKPEPLTKEEWLKMEKHPGFAYEMLSPIRYLRQALDIPYCHHEKWDGSGYPRGLKGDHIPLVARIFAVVDVWDALMSDRPYRKAWTEEKAREHIQNESGRHFDPQVVDVFLRNITDDNKEASETRQ